MMARALINVPAKAKRGEVIEIKTLISHEMETGFRYDNTGKLVPRDIITLFVCKYNGEEIFRAELYPPFPPTRSSRFTTVATDSGTIEFEWSRRQRFLGDRIRHDHRRMSAAGCRRSDRRPFGAMRRRSPPISRLPIESPAMTYGSRDPRHAGR